jgi:hypothetical protein
MNGGSKAMGNLAGRAPRHTVIGNQFDIAAATNRDVVRCRAQFVTVCRSTRLIDVH